jgi:hypothetical protein
LRTATFLLTQESPALDGPPACAVPWAFLRKVASRGSVLLWLGNFAPAEMPVGWRELQARYQTVGVRADDPWDTELPEGAQFAAYDPLAGRLTTINTSSSAERAAHARWCERREEHFANLFPRLDERLTVRNTDDPLKALIAYFQRRTGAGVHA